MSPIPARLSGVPLADLDEVWPQVREGFARLCEKRGDGLWRTEDYERAVRGARMQLWIVKAEMILAAILTEIVVEPRGKKLRVLMLHGRERRRWLHLLGQLEEWARGIGCDLVEVVGRRGWQRELPGYRFKCMTMEKGL